MTEKFPELSKKTTLSNDSPVFTLPDHQLVPVSAHYSQMVRIPTSQMFIVKEALKQYREAYPDRPVFDASQGDGGASLSGVPEGVLIRAAELQAQHGSGYDMPYGTEEFRRLVYESYWRINPGTGIEPENIIATAGGRDALLKAYQAMLHLGHGRQGDVVLVTRVPWISYTWGVYGIGANLLLAPGQPDSGWALSEDTIQESVKFANHHGRQVAALVITSPDNPTGRTLSLLEQVKLAKSALAARVKFVLFDWIYHFLTDESPIDLNAFVSHFSTEERERLIFLDGITKSLGGSNIRNAHLIASREVVRFINAYASHGILPSYYSQAVAMAAYEMGYSQASKDIINPVNASRQALTEILDDYGYRYVIGKGYYTFIDTGDYLRARNWRDSSVLGSYLAREHGLAIVPGVFFSDFGRDWIRFSYALPPQKTIAAAKRLDHGLASLEM